MTTSAPRITVRGAGALAMIWLMVSAVVAPLMAHQTLAEEKVVFPSGDVWNQTQQPWAQYARTPTHNQTVPPHGPDGGPGDGSVANVSELATLHTPVVNWQVFSDNG